MQFFRNRKDRLPVAIISLVFLIDLLLYFFCDSLLLLSLWVTSALCIKIFIAAWNHHHQHCLTFHQPWLNRCLEVIYTFHTGITTNVWILHHNLGHHVNYLDQKQDESGWTRDDGTKMGVIEYTLTIAITGYARAFGVGNRYPKFKKGMVQMGLVNLLLILGMVYYRPISAFLLFLIPMLLIYLGTCWNTYYHHAGLDCENHLEASHNILNRYYNIVSGNLGYHTAHHIKQGLHWSKLPEYHAKIADDIPPELISHDFPVIGPLSKKLKLFVQKPLIALGGGTR